MAKVNGITPSKINGITIGAAGTAVTVGTWANRPGTGDASTSASDGDWFQASSSADGVKASYRYSSTIGEWVRPEVYEGSPVRLARIRGSVLPSAESPAWTHTTANAGTITTDGTKVTFEADNSNNDLANVKYTHLKADTAHFFQGLVQSIGNQTGAGNNRGRSIVIDINSHKTTDKHVMVTLNTNANTASFAKGYWSAGGINRYSSLFKHPGYEDFGTQLQKDDGIADATTSEVLMEIYTTMSGCYLYVDNSPTPTAVNERAHLNNSNSTTSASYIVGNWGTGEQGKMTVREAFFGTWSHTANTASIFGAYGGS